MLKGQVSLAGMCRSSTGYEQMGEFFMRAAFGGLGRAENDPNREGVQLS